LGGLYEQVFNQNTQFEDMLSSMYLLMLLATTTTEGDFEKVLRTELIYILALSKLIFSKYVTQKYRHIPPTNKKIKELFEKGETTIFIKIFDFIQSKLNEFSKNIEISEMSEVYYDKLKEYFEKMQLSIQ